MAGSRFFCALMLISGCGSLSASAQTASAPVVTLTPSNVEAGSPEIIRVAAPAEAKPEGEWLGRKLDFFRADTGDVWYALAGVDVEAPSGPSQLDISVTAGSVTQNLIQTILIYPAHYRTSTLSVAPRFIAPSGEELRQIDDEKKIKAAVFAASIPERLWHGGFRAPVRAEPTDSFGTRRVFNGELSSIHKGMDFRARTGTPVVADNAGIVVLARPLYYEGNCVILDHGLGLFTMDMHLSRIRVREGQRVAKGQLLGLSGATGRVTGPHLHWAVRWQGAYLDPAKLLTLNLTALP